MKILLALLALPALAHADLWVPEQMIEGRAYRGIVVLDEPPEDFLEVLLSSDNPRSAGVPPSVRVGPSSNHGVFEIEAKSAGSASISAIVGGRLLSESAQVSARPDGPASLHVTLPASSAQAGTMTGYVTVLDSTGAPAATQTAVRLTTSGGLSAPSRVEVPPGAFQAPFWVGVSGDGSITAEAPGLAPHTASVKHARQGVDVRMAVAPRIAMPDSHVFYYVWLEKDGRPFRPPYAVEAFLHTGDESVARPAPAPQGASAILLSGGVARGILYTGERGVSTVTAVAPRLGTAQDVLHVGPARLGGGTGAEPLLREQDLAGPAPEAGRPDLLLSWIYPSVTDGEAWAVAAAYSSQVSRALSPDGSGVAEEAVLVPARLPGGILHASSGPGLEHRGAHPMLEKTTKTNAVEFAVRGTGQGEHVLRASGQGMDSGNEARVRVMPAHAADLEIRVEPLPALHGARQDLALVSLLDGGAAADPAGLLGRAQLSVSAVSAGLESGSARFSGSSAVVSGTLTGTGSITASLEGVGSGTAPLAPSGSPSPPSLSAPGRVHAGELFPFALHGHPGPVPPPRVTGVSSELGASLSGGMMALERAGSGQVLVATEAGSAGAPVEAFENSMDLRLSLSGTELRVGEQLVLEADARPGARYQLETDLPFERAGPGAFLVTVDREGRSVLSVTAERAGFAPASASASVSGRLAHSLHASASDSRGGPLRPEFSTSAGWSATAPHSAELPPGPLSVEFPQEHREAGRGYGLADVLLDGRSSGPGRLELHLSGDARAEAIYERRVLVSVEGGLGSGTYGEGQTVRVSAPDRPASLPLVREVFDRWEGLDSDSAEHSFEASRDLYVRAVYREDWSHLLLAISAPMAAAALLAFGRGSERLRWALEMLRERKSGR